MTDDDLQAKEDAETREYYADQERERYEKRIADLLARIAALRECVKFYADRAFAPQRARDTIAADDEAQND